MDTHAIIRAWRDPEYRASLGAKEQRSLPAHPAGPIELRESELDAVAGAAQNSSRAQCTPVGVCRTRDSICNSGICTIVWG